MRHPCVLQGNKHAVNQNHLKQQFDFQTLLLFLTLVLVMGMHSVCRAVCPLSLDLINRAARTNPITLKISKSSTPKVHFFTCYINTPGISRCQVPLDYSTP